MNKGNIIITLLASSTLAFSSIALAKVEGPTLLIINGNQQSATEVLSWSWGASNSSSYVGSIGSGGGAGKASFQDISLIRYSDGLSASFIHSLATGQHYPSIELARDGLSVLLENVIFSSYSVGGSINEKEPQSETLSLIFSQVTYSIDGSSYCFSIVDNTQC